LHLSKPGKLVPPLSSLSLSELELVLADARTLATKRMSCWGRSSGTSPASRLR
jgi:hypothetical protein